MIIQGDRVRGHDTVNPFKGKLTISGERLVISELAVGAAGTVGDAGVGAAFFHAVITSSPTCRIDGDRLVLTDGQGRVLEFARS